MNVNKIVIALFILLLLIFLYFLLIPGERKDMDEFTEVTVDCNNPNQSLAAVLKEDRRRRIRVVGKCEEDRTVLITRDNIVIDGRGTGTIYGKYDDRPVIKVRGAKNVIIRGLTVSNGQHGILTVRGATVGLANVNAVNNSISGISFVGQPCAPKQHRDRSEKRHPDKSGMQFNVIREAVAASHCDTLTNPTVNQPGSGVTIDLENPLLCDEINANDNEISGIHILNGSEVEFSGATVNALENSGVGFVQDHGIVVEDTPSIVFINSASAINAKSNSSHGIITRDHALIVVEDASSTFTSSDNGGAGLFIGAHTTDFAGVECDNNTTLHLVNNASAVDGVVPNPADSIIGCQISSAP